MTLGERHSRPQGTRSKQIIDRLYRETGTGSVAPKSFTAICDMISIPRDLRARLLDQLVREGYVTREGDGVRLTEAGKHLALTPAPSAEAPRSPSPHDRESRARTPGSGRTGNVQNS